MGELLERLGRECCEARIAAGFGTLSEIADRIPTSRSTCHRLETGVRWIDDVEEVVAGYERECGLPPGELWRRAVNP